MLHAGLWARYYMSLFFAIYPWISFNRMHRCTNRCMLNTHNWMIFNVKYVRFSANYGLLFRNCCNLISRIWFFTIFLCHVYEYFICQILLRYRQLFSESTDTQTLFYFFHGLTLMWLLQGDMLSFWFHTKIPAHILDQRATGIKRLHKLLLNLQFLI